MDSLAPPPEIVKPPGSKNAQVCPNGAAPILSCNRTRQILAGLKGCKKIDHLTLVRLVKKEGLPKHDDPFGSGRWCFVEAEVTAWWNARMATGTPKPVPGPGRPRKQVA